MYYYVDRESPVPQNLFFTRACLALSATHNLQVRAIKNCVKKLKNYKNNQFFSYETWGKVGMKFEWIKIFLFQLFLLDKDMNESRHTWVIK